jgi:hypothetical protein
VTQLPARGTLVPMLGLPDAISACLFDLDGVLTTTAELHARAVRTPPPHAAVFEDAP